MTEAEFTQFVSQTKRAVLSAVRANLRPDLAHSIDDVVQETYLRIYRHVERTPLAITEPSRVNAWAYVIARNEARRWSARQARHVGAAELPEAIDPKSQAREQQFNDRQELQSLFDLLPEKFRAPLEHLLEDRSTAEIAALLGVPDGTVKSRISRGRGMLRQFLQMEAKQ